eukprot:TRINITY_DN12782_c0_g5_i1.p2 TRINITY_DN12782_c0_g5~~TRINITY_DN12782_c0_g5_i1.p2  ORF type:complete len:111 (+),score=37.38 TRINITY_DN12782_c0_g5_i1:680-1012(+)
MIVEAYAPLGSFGTSGGRDWKDNVLEDKVIKELSEKYEKTPAQIVLNWGLKRNYVVLPKTVNKGRLGENIASGNFEMSVEDQDKITALNKNLRCFDMKTWESQNYLPIFA